MIKRPAYQESLEMYAIQTSLPCFLMTDNTSCKYAHVRHPQELHTNGSKCHTTEKHIQNNVEDDFWVIVQ